MAYIPQIIAAASFATEHMICVGDFRQLAPIVQEPLAKETLGKDLFEYLGINAGYRDIRLHPWLVMLDEQRRMHPAISAFPSRHVYSRLLKDYEGMEFKRQDIASTSPFHHPLCLIDLFGTCCCGGKCPRCGRDQFAVRGRSEVFVKCAEDHIYKLDEI